MKTKPQQQVKETEEGAVEKEAIPPVGSTKDEKEAIPPVGSTKDGRNTKKMNKK